MKLDNSGREQVRGGALIRCRPLVQRELDIKEF
jgi:hypothetical protein